MECLCIVSVINKYCVARKCSCGEIAPPETKGLDNLCNKCRFVNINNFIAFSSINLVLVHNYESHYLLGERKS